MPGAAATTSILRSPKELWRAIGPGVLFTGAAVGVSHLVQSTRAGADYGLTLMIVVVLANLVKYPAFRFGAEYAAVTRTSLLEGYRQQGKWALWLYALVTLATMFTVQAAVTLVTAGLAKYLFGLSSSALTISLVLTILCAGLLLIGQYRWLDRVAKVVVASLTVTTLAATAMVIPKVNFAGLALMPDFGAMNTKDVFFIAALVGWMPTAIDIAVWQSLWTLARRRDVGEGEAAAGNDASAALFDFNAGYWGTAFLALCFVLLGAGVMFGTGVEFDPRAGVFAGQLVDLYAQTLGEWSRYLIGACAFLTMFSTTLTVVDGFPRAIAILVARFRGPEPVGGDDEKAPAQRKAYWASLFVLGAGSLTVVAFFLTSLKAMVDLATTASFLTAPVLAWLNHRAMTSGAVPVDRRPPRWVLHASWAGVVLLGGFALYYLYLLLGA